MKPEYLKFTSEKLSSIERGVVAEILETGEISVEVKAGAHRSGCLDRRNGGSFQVRGRCGGRPAGGES